MSCSMQLHYCCEVSRVRLRAIFLLGFRSEPQSPACERILDITDGTGTVMWVRNYSEATDHDVDLPYWWALSNQEAMADYDETGGSLPSDGYSPGFSKEKEMDRLRNQRLSS